MREIKIGRFLGEDRYKEQYSKGRFLTVERQFLNLTSDNKEEIIFQFGNVRGGDILQALKLSRTIIESDITTVAHVHASVYSAGMIALLGCYPRIGKEGCVIKFHPGYYLFRGAWLLDNMSLAKWQALVKKHNARVADLLRERTRWNNEQIHEILTLQKGALKLTHKEALEAGVLTEVVGSF